MKIPITISEQDAFELRKLIQSSAGAQAENLHRLESEIDRARIVPAARLPNDVIAMNSTVELEDLSDGEISTYTLVFPQAANVEMGRISVLAPLGMGMLGFKVGDEFEWPGPTSTLRLRVRRLLATKPERELASVSSSEYPTSRKA